MAIRYRKYNKEDQESVDQNSEIWGEDVSKLECKADIQSASDPNNIITKYLADTLYDSHMSGNRKGGNALQRQRRKFVKSNRNN